MEIKSVVSSQTSTTDYTFYKMPCVHELVKFTSESVLVTGNIGLNRQKLEILWGKIQLEYKHLNL